MMTGVRRLRTISACPKEGGRTRRSEIIRLNLIWIIPAKELMRAKLPFPIGVDTNQV